MLLNHSPSFILGPHSSHNNEFPAPLGQQCTQSLPIGGQLRAEKKMSKNPRLSSPIFVFEFRNFVTSPPAISTTVQFILLCTESTLSHSHTPIILLIPRWLTFARMVQTTECIFSLFTSPRHYCCSCSCCYSPVHTGGSNPTSISWR